MKIDYLPKQRLQKKVSPEACSDLHSNIYSGIRSGAELLQHILGAERVYIFMLASVSVLIANETHQNTPSSLNDSTSYFLRSLMVTHLLPLQRSLRTLHQSL